ncbi:hypothetical protein FRC09_019092, partial [Ceratobasidium sp. 395]
MSQDLNKHFRYWLKPRSDAIDLEKGLSSSPTDQPDTAIDRFSQRFITQTDAQNWITPNARTETTYTPGEDISGEQQTAAIREGVISKPKLGKEDRIKQEEDRVKREWTFHNPIHNPKPPSDHPKGYLHNAYYNIVAVENILGNKFDLDAFIGRFKAMPSYDEYTEIIVIPTRTGDNYPCDSWELRFVDHFNRRFLTQEEFKKGPNENYGRPTAAEQSYRKWMKLMADGNSHYYKPSSDKAKQCLGRKIAQQIVWDYQTTHVVKDVDIEGAFSISDCSSLLSALQKKRVSDKQCQKMIKAVIKRFLRSTPINQRPKIGQNSDAVKIPHPGPFTTCGMILFFIAWTGPLLHVPFPYFRRLQLLSTRADKGEYVPDLWKTFIKSLLKEWTDLNIILALILAANVAFLALPGTSNEIPEGKSPALVDISRAAGIISMFMTMSGLLTSL